MIYPNLFPLFSGMIPRRRRVSPGWPDSVLSVSIAADRVCFSPATTGFLSADFGKP
jgi:hypothetical protein